MAEKILLDIEIPTGRIEKARQEVISYRGALADLKAEQKLVKKK